FKPDDDLEDLRTEQQEETQTLKLVNPERYLRAPTIDRSQKNSVLQIPTNLNNLKQEIFYLRTEQQEETQTLKLVNPERYL
ncbi:unnamed protein product, partial [Rotaria sp. Silwood1]